MQAWWSTASRNRRSLPTTLAAPDHCPGMAVSVRFLRRSLFGCGARRKSIAVRNNHGDIWPEPEHLVLHTPSGPLRPRCIGPLADVDDSHSLFVDLQSDKRACRWAASGEVRLKAGISTVKQAAMPWACERTQASIWLHLRPPPTDTNQLYLSIQTIPGISHWLRGLAGLRNRGQGWSGTLATS